MLLVTFSGLDGCGKSTHVETAGKFLESRGYRVRLLISHRISFSGFATIAREIIRSWRQGVAQTREISSTGHVIRRLPGNRTFDEDRNRRDVRLKRLIIYPLDSLILTVWLLAQKMRGVDAVVTDRYVYDRLVNLPHPDGFFSRFLLALVPHPNVAVFLNVPPAVCRARREEHPEDYYLSKHESYLQVAKSFRMTVVANEDVCKATNEITKILAAVVDQ